MAAPGEFTERAITGAAASGAARPVMVRPVLVHPTGFRMSPYADIKPAEDAKAAARRARQGHRASSGTPAPAAGPLTSRVLPVDRAEGALTRLSMAAHVDQRRARRRSPPRTERYP